MPEFDLVIVTTGAGFEPATLVPFLGKAVEPKRPLLKNEAATLRLSRAIKQAVEEPSAKPPVEQPHTAARVTGKYYRFAKNPLGFTGIRFDSSRFSQAHVRMSLSAAITASAAGEFDLTAGLDESHQFSDCFFPELTENFGSVC